MLAWREPGIKQCLAFFGRGTCERSALRWHQRHGEIEATAGPQLAPYTEFAAHGMDQALADRQSKPRPSRRGAGAGLPECFEYLLKVLFFDSDSCVPNLAIQLFSFLSGNNERHSASRCKFDRVSKKIQENLSQVAAINHNMGRYIRIYCDGKAQTFSMCRLGNNMPEVHGEL